MYLDRTFAQRKS